MSWPVLAGAVVALIVLWVWQRGCHVNETDWLDEGDDRYGD